MDDLVGCAGLDNVCLDGAGDSACAPAMFESTNTAAMQNAAALMPFVFMSSS
jgi:hypothetical protein